MEQTIQNFIPDDFKVLHRMQRKEGCFFLPQYMTFSRSKITIRVLHIEISCRIQV